MKYRGATLKITSGTFGGYRLWQVFTEQGQFLDTWNAPTPTKPWAKGITRVELKRILEENGYVVT